MRVSGVIVAFALVLSSWGGSAAYAQSADASRSQASAQPSQQVAAMASSALDAVKTAFEKRFDGVEVTSVRQAPIDGLYEIQVDMDLVYVDANVDHLIQGALIDARTRTDLTAARIQKLSEVPFDSLPLELAVKMVKGDGSRKLAVFEDPNCIYCKQLHANLKDIDNVTVYSFLYPILSPDSAAKARNVWCASDPAAVWQGWMLDGKEPADAQCDDDPVEQVLKLGRQLTVRGTPAILFADGSRVSGALPTDQLKLKLNALD